MIMQKKKIYICTCPLLCRVLRFSRFVVSVCPCGTGNDTRIHVRASEHIINGGVKYLLNLKLGDI